MRVPPQDDRAAAHPGLISGKDGELRGAPLFLIGGGPSLETLNLELMRASGAPRLAVNMGFVKGAEAVVVGDSWVRTELVQENAMLLQRWRGFAGPKWLVRMEQEAVMAEHVPDMKLVPAIQKWGTSLASGVLGVNNTGLCALNVADVLGAGKVYMLGFDMNAVPGQVTTNWHQFYPKDRLSDSVSIFQNMIAAFEKWAQAPRCAVVNCNPTSALQCFPYQPFEEAVEEARRSMLTFEPH